MPSTISKLLTVIAAVTIAVPSAFAATGAGADDGASETSVRLPQLPENSGPFDSASTVKTSPASLQPPKHNGFDELSVSVGDENYISQPNIKGGATNFEEIAARVRAMKTGPLFSAAIDAGASVAANVSNYTNFEVPEAYFRLSASNVDPDDVQKADQKVDQKSGPKIQPSVRSASLTIGRKKERWSGLDSDWSLGLVQPFNKFDALRPTEQGLMGVFLEGQVGPLSLMAFGTPLYIPEQGAPYQLDSGRFSTTSPWFQTPPDQLILLGQTRSALYTIDMPSISSILSHSTFGFRARLAEQANEGFYLQGSVLRGPMPAINLGFTGQLSIVEGDSYGDVTVEPAVVNHTITAADAGYDGKNFAVGVSMLHEVPDNPTLYDGLTTSNYSNMTMLSPSVEFKTFPSMLWGPRFRIAYLATDGGQVSAVGEYAQNGNVFGPRTMYRHAISSSVETTLHRTDRWTLDISARWVEELDELGTVLMSDLRLGLGDSWRLALQADVLGSRQPTSDTDTFIARFRANDRASLRVTYFF